MDEGGQKSSRSEGRIPVGEFRLGARIIIQKCRKCGVQTESDHLLVSCPKRKPFCDGLMSIELEYYIFNGDRLSEGPPFISEG